MRNPIISRPGGVVSLDRKRFDDVCAELMRHVSDDRRPDALIGIRTGGLVVAEAVDSGTTLSLVLDAVRRRAPHAATIRSAAITVTTERPLTLPDYALYHRQLCRFPWSLDALTDS